MSWKNGLRVLVRPRRAGKTHDAIQWVLEGEKTSFYPGWSRVLLVPNMREADELRGPDNPHGLDYRQVFYVDEWRRAMIPRRDEIQTAVDNADQILRNHLESRIGLLTMTGDVRDHD